MVELESYLEALASHEPIPGGGSAATLVGAVGAALAAMVARIASRNPKYAALHAAAGDAVRRADALAAALTQAGRRDEAAFAQVVSAQAMDRGDAEQARRRKDALETALGLAAEAPLAAGQLALDVLHLTRDVLDIPAPGLASDVGCAAEFARAALAGSAYNVRVNHRFMHDEARIAEQEARLRACEAQGAAAFEAIRSEVAARLARG